MNFTFYTKEEAEKTNWPCYMCEYDPARREAPMPPEICHNCSRQSNCSKPNNFELLKWFLIPSKRPGEKGWTTLELQMLRDQRINEEKEAWNKIKKEWFQPLTPKNFPYLSMILGIIIAILILYFWS